MKKLFLTLSLVFVSTMLFAYPSLHDLGNAWKNAPSIKAKEDKNDITIVYGGKDISLRPSLQKQSTIA